MSLNPSYIKRIQSHFPDIDLNQAYVNADGLMNNVIIIDDQVFRFPKDEFSKKSLHQEAKFLKMLAPYLDVKVPMLEILEDDMTVCNKIPGIALYRHHFLSLSPDKCRQVIQQMGTFLYQLHHIPQDVLQANTIAPSLSRHSREAYLKLYEDVQQELFPIMFATTRKWVEYVFEPLLSDETFLDSESVFIHDDLFQNHILYDESQQKITGVIDFGVAGMGDPAKDFALIINSYGESVIEQFTDVYPLTEKLLNRARFYATVLEMVWVIEGIRNKDNAWFTAHLDRARDIRPYQ